MARGICHLTDYGTCSLPGSMMNDLANPYSTSYADEKKSIRFLHLL